MEKKDRRRRNRKMTNISLDVSLYVVSSYLLDASDARLIVINPGRGMETFLSISTFAPVSSN